MSADAASQTSTATTAYEYLWMHFTRMSSYENSPDPTIVRGEGTYIYDDTGKRYPDGLAGLFVVQAGHGRQELAEVAAKQAAELAFFPVWSYAHPKAVELAERLAHYAPGDLNKVFFSTGGGEAAWKLAKQYHSSTAITPSTRRYHGPSPTTAPRRAPCPSPACPPSRLRSSRWSPTRTRCRTRTSIARPSMATTPRPSAAGPPTRSRPRSSSRARTRSPRSSWSRCRTPAGVSLRILPAGPRDLRPA